MSMSEFERQSKGSGDDCSLRSMRDRELPDDFTAEEMAFAQELDALFDPTLEELPPYFVQTLLESEAPHFQAVERGFEKKTSARVFRLLKLRRCLFRSSSVQMEIGRLLQRRSILGAMSAMLLVMVLFMTFTAPSFANGLSILWAGPHSKVGVVGVNHLSLGATPGDYALHHAGDAVFYQDGPIDLLDAQRRLHFSMYWPQPYAVPDNYDLKNIYIYERADQTWADGPIMELDYDYMFPGVTPVDGGRIAICEFKPMGQMLQVVQLGAAHQLKIDSHGNASAISVDGQWTSINQSSQVWVHNGRNELIYERDGVIFWLVGHENDGVTSDTLLNLATSLQPLDVTYIMRMGRILHSVTSVDGQAPELMDGDIFYLQNPDNSDGPTLRVVGAHESPPALSAAALQNANRLKSLLPVN